LPHIAISIVGNEYEVRRGIMESGPAFDAVVLFVVFIFPGLISIHIYRLHLPARDIDWKNVITEALFYSCLNFALCLPILVPLHAGGLAASNPYLYVGLLMVVLLVTPVVFTSALCWALRSRRLMARLQLPYPTAWDYFFDARKPAFVLIQLKNGCRIGGFYGPKSYATSFPREGDIYLEAVFEVDEHGRFGDMIDNSAGVLVRKDEYELVEFFEIPEQNVEKESTDVCTE
jgi:hypothetical protein